MLKYSRLFIVVTKRMRNRRTVVSILTSVGFLFSAILLFTKCFPDDINEINLKVEYSYGTNWLSLPAIIHQVDAFYVYPTISDNTMGYMDIANAEEREMAVRMFKTQASVFDPFTNVFAPYYRQMSSSAYIPKSELVSETDAFKLGAYDILTAFDYYVEHLNKNRPFIIAGHGQGTITLIELLKTRIGNNAELRKRLVAGYLIGYTVTDVDLAVSNLSAAQCATDVGVIVTFNTQSANSEGGPMLLPGANCINPLNWRTDSTPADSVLNLGAVFFDQSGESILEIENYCGAKIDTKTGALITTIPEGEMLDTNPYPEGIYHRFDYSLWYRNLQENVKARIEAYYSK